jgi:hypothetical protein
MPPVPPVTKAIRVCFGLRVGTGSILSNGIAAAIEMVELRMRGR